MEQFSSWDKLPEKALGSMDRKIYYGEKIMLVKNEIHPKEVVPMHSHEHEQMLYVLEGECDVITEKGKAHLKAGGLALFLSNEEHQVINTEDKTLVAIDIFSPIREDFL